MRRRKGISHTPYLFVAERNQTICTALLFVRFIVGFKAAYPRFEGIALFSEKRRFYAEVRTKLAKSEKT